LGSRKYIGTWTSFGTWKVTEVEKVTETEKVAEPAEEASVEAKADVDLGDSIAGDNLKKNTDENVENTDNDVKASGLSKL